MIEQKGNLFCLNTAHTSYLFRIEPAGHLEHLHYGASVRMAGDAEAALCRKCSSLPSATIAYSRTEPTLSMELLRGEISTLGKGDQGDPFVDLEFSDGSRTCDFVFDSAKILREKGRPKGLPGALEPEDGKGQTLCVRLKEAHGRGVTMELLYTVYEECDVILRSSRLMNTGDTPVTLRRLLSSQVDFEDSDYVMTNFHGSWSNEMHRSDTPCGGKTVVSETRLGFSSNRANPFVMLSRRDCTETAGEVYGSNLIYSGSHRECAQSGELERLRFSTGIQPEGFLWVLAPGESFEAPEAVLSFSDRGFGGLSQNFHSFIRRYIVRGTWAKKARPVLLNSWEAAYFDFDEEKILKLARTGAKLGVELFVLDDGWFGKRNSSRTSMGDWYCNLEKLPNGIRGLSDKIHELGMKFGIWVEPEMISEDSDLFRAHPDWSIAVPGQHHSEGRYERLIDFCNPEVVDHIYNALHEVFSSGVDYVKWDMNRGFSDFYSPSLPAERQGEMAHRFQMGLYDLLGRLNAAFPNILFESCASGGNRADLGLLCYMPQFWASDNTDALCRERIQTNYSYGYPMTVLGCHVSACPNHQTLRETSLSTRFEVASMGLLGYELDLNRLSEDELQDIAQQIEQYKSCREWLMDSKFYRLKTGEEGRWSAMAVSRDRKHAVAMTMQELLQPGRPAYVLRTRGLDGEKNYRFTGREAMQYVKPYGGHFKSLPGQEEGKAVRMEREKEEFVVSGSLMNHSGIRLKSDFIGHGLDDDTRYYPDCTSRFYQMEQVEE